MCRWSTSLPGVAMTISGLLLRAASCVLLSRPPEKREGGEEWRGKREREREWRKEVGTEGREEQFLRLTSS